MRREPPDAPRCDAGSRAGLADRGLLKPPRPRRGRGLGVQRTRLRWPGVPVRRRKAAPSRERERRREPRPGGRPPRGPRGIGLRVAARPAQTLAADWGFPPPGDRLPAQRPDCGALEPRSHRHGEEVKGGGVESPDSRGAPLRSLGLATEETSAHRRATPGSREATEESAGEPGGPLPSHSEAAATRTRALAGTPIDSHPGGTPTTLGSP
ncbi:hypothetical protein NDU88_005342 [Pleurodeles waltl]|uniref:Uncharacterized protein n=1 Tax=Pleurodeles waltl TaxID=8319 RepID=A0AAV7QKF3_PLEWA|nr:hypothetical protein NDU88_005342 [Pleurodeles waltl]